MPTFTIPLRAVYWLKRSADNGNDYAAYRLGKEYLSGKNAQKDAATAAEYLRQAADNGSTYAQYLLGKLALMGEGVPKDMGAAYEWFAAARDNGHAYAEFFMKRMERGEQEPPSVLLAATRLLYHMGNIFRDNAPAMPTVGGIHIDRKRLAGAPTQSALPLAISRTITNSNRRDIRCSSVDPANAKGNTNHVYTLYC